MAMQLKHNFIVLCQQDDVYGLTKDGYNYICWSDLLNQEKVHVAFRPFGHYPYFIQRLYHSYKDHKLPIKYLYPFFCKNPFPQKDLCILLIRFPSLEYLRWLRKTYKSAKIVIFLRDLYETKKPLIDYYRDEKLIDFWITYDELESIKYNMFFHPEVESKLDLTGIDTSIRQTVFFAGFAKDRLKLLIDIYDKFTMDGFECKYYIVSENHRKTDERPGVTYSSEKMPYKDILINSIQSECILEVCQEGAVGNTARFLEAVMYNKKLLTNNTSLGKDRFFNSNFIHIFNSVDDINTTFLKNKTVVDYGYQGEFSPLHLLEYIDSIL